MKRKKIACLLIAGLMVTSLGSAIPSQSNTSTLVSNFQTVKAATTTTDSAITVTPTVATPTTPTISLIKGGNKRVKIYWNKISGASGYKVYYSTTKNGTYTLAKTINNNSTLKYVKTGLTQNQTYYFKITAFNSQNGVVAESGYSSILSAKTGTIAQTSKAAKTYSGKAKYKASPAYKKYKALKTRATYTKSFPIPGMKNTNVGGFASTTMVPRGICQAGAYILITAYDSTGYDESVIYVMSRSTHSYLTTIVLPVKTKVQNIASDGTNIWISNGSNVAYFPLSVISTAVAAGTNFYTLASYTDTLAVNTTTGIIAYHDNVLWIGKSGSASASTMYGYTINTVNGKVSLTSTYSMTIPSRTRGVTFDNSGYMYLIRTNKTNPTQANYVSNIRTFKPSLTSPTAKGAIKKGSIIKKYALPPRAEGVFVYGNYLYNLYSSCKYSASKYPVDRVIATKLTLLQ